MRQLLIAAVAVLLASPATAVDGPMHGRPRYDKIEEREWIYYLTERNTDWYLQPKVDIAGETVKTLIRGVSPGTDSYGLLQLNCKKREYSAYYEAWAKIPVSAIFLNQIYKDFCNLKIAY